MNAHSHLPIIDAIGAARLRAALGIGSSATVSNWRQRGIPLAQLARVKAVADAAGVALPADFLEPLGIADAAVDAQFARLSGAVAEVAKGQAT